MKPTFAKKLIASYLFVVTITLLLTGAYLTHRLKADLLSNLEQSLFAQAQLMRNEVAPVVLFPLEAPPLQVLAHKLGKQMGCRVTIVRADGIVQADSERSEAEVALMDNHKTRPEIQAALKTSAGQSIRFSRTLLENMLYVAIPIAARESEDVKNPSPWGVLRVALPLTEVDKRILTFRSDLLKAGLAALGVAFLVALITVRKTSQPLRDLASMARAIGQGQYTADASVTSADEFGQLARAFSEMSLRIEDKVKELSQERTQLAAILSALVEGVVAVDHAGQVLFLNPAAEKFFAVSSADIRGRPVLEVLRHNALYEVIQHILRERQKVSQEIFIHTPQERTLTVHAVPVSYGDDRLGILLALHDVTDLRKLERVRQEFVANVSHELKTPLTSIKGYVETLLEGALEDPKHNREFLKIIDEHAKQLTLLIDDVLDLSAIEAKRMEYRFEPVSLAEVSTRLLKGLAPMAKAKGVKIDNRLTDQLPKVRADKDKLAQILMNLIDNAIKFNQANGLVELSGRVDPGVITVTIKDTGVGIAAEHLPRVFERFYRADKARSHEITGTGLGLAIVKHLVEAHQGTVAVESQPGHGSTFSFTLTLSS